MKIKFYKQDTPNHFNWSRPPEIDIDRELVPGDKFRLSRHGKYWTVVDVAWCFKDGKFTHFKANVV